MASQALAVKRDYGSMVDGSEIDEIPFALKGFRTEFGAVPDASLIIIELFVLGVPVSGDADVSGAVEAVFYEFCAIIVKTLVGKEGAGIGMGHLMIVVIAQFVRVHQILPLPIQRHAVSVRDIYNLRGRCFFSGKGGEKCKHQGRRGANYSLNAHLCTL